MTGVNRAGLVASIVQTFTNQAVAFPYNDDGIDNAVAQIVASGKPGVVLYAAVDYTITRSHPYVSGVSHVGIYPTLQYTGDIPDALTASKGGTRFIQAAGTTAQIWNNVDKTTSESPLTSFLVSDFMVYGISYVGGLRAIDIGALKAMGAVNVVIDRVYSFDQTGDFPFDYKNVQHCAFGSHAIYSNNVTTGGGWRLASMLDQNVLIPGNSDIFGDIYTYCRGIKLRNITIEARNKTEATPNPSPSFQSQLNQIKVSARLQGNRYGASTPVTVSAVFTAGSTITIADNTQFDACQVGMPIRFTTGTVPTNYTDGVVYFVTSRDAGTNTITLAETHNAATALNGSAGTFSFFVSGHPSISIQADAGCTITNSDFGQLDLEAFAAVSEIYLCNLSNCTGFISEIMSTYVTDPINSAADRNRRTGIVPRNVQGKFFAPGDARVTMDQSASCGQITVTGTEGATRVISAVSDFELDGSYNGQEIRYTGSGNINLTVPNNLPKGFTLSLTCTTLGGSVTFVPTSGGAVFGPYGAVIRGLQATGRLRCTANKVFYLEVNSLARPWRTLTAAATTILGTDQFLRGDATSNNQVFTLPPAAQCAGQTFMLKKIDASANTVQLKGNGAETIDGSNTKTLTAQYQSVTVVSNSVSFDIIGTV